MAFFPQETGGLLGGIFKQGDFQIDPNTTPEMLKAKRDVLAAMMPRYGQAKYIGEGIGQLGHAFASNRQHSAMNKFEGERSAEAAEMFNRVMSGSGNPNTRSGPLSILGLASPDAPAPQPAPNPDQQIASDAMAAIGKPPQQPQQAPQGREEFIQAMMPHAMRVSQETGLDPRVVIAQAAQETGWGKHAPGNNYFGIKSHGQSGGNSFATNEVIDGQTVRITDSFRGYDSMGDSVDGYAEFLKKNPRYRDMLSAPDLGSQIAALGKSGYATDPNYANSVGSIARSIQVPEQAAGNSFAPGPGTQVAQASGPALNDLMMAAQNPWLTPAQRGVINTQIEQQQRQQQMQQQQQIRRDDAIFTQQLSQQDPLYQARVAEAQRKAQSGGDVPASVQELQWRAQAAGLQPGTPEYQSFVLNGGGDPATFRALDMQAQAAGLEQGTPEYAEFMATRGAGLQAGARVTAENLADTATAGDAERAKAAGAAAGKADVEKGSELAEMERNMPGLLAVAEQLDELADDATYTMAGRFRDEAMKQLGMDPSDGALARAEYIAVVDNQVLPLLRQTFGAAFTAKEGDTLRATLGDPDKSPAEKKAVLNAFIEQKKRDLIARGGTVPSETAASSAPSAEGIPPLPSGLAERGVTPERWPSVWNGLSEQAKQHYRSLSQ